MRNAWLRLALLLPCLAAAALSRANELSLLGGAVRANGETSHAWAMDWTHAFGDHTALSATWLNEGHVTDHHRDGGALQGWLRTRVSGSPIVIGVGAGPYTYFDTTRPTSSDNVVVDEHGWGFMYSVGATWELGNSWLVHLRANYIDTRHSYDSTSVMIGAGYRFDAAPASSMLPSRQLNEVTVSPGITIANNFESQKGFAKAVEFRRAITQNVGVNAMWLDEGKSDAVRRNGIALQLGFVHPLSTPNWTIGAAIGPYYSFRANTDAQIDGEGPHHLSAIGTLSTAYWFRHDSGVRLSWSRVATDDERDTDVFLLGLSYRF